MSGKRKAPLSASQAVAKRRRPDVPDYLATPTLKDDAGMSIWPAPRRHIDQAREVIKQCARAAKTTVICPDKDADGLSSGVILHRTLVLLGLSPDLIHVQLLDKGGTIFSDTERAKLRDIDPAYIFILDHGSRSSPPLLSTPHTTVVIDHHHATPADFPEGSIYVTACNSPPVATTSLLIYEICRPLHESVQSQTDWLCIIGTHGDLGTTLKWSPPFPDMSAPLKQYTKKALNDAVSALNAPRRTATYDVTSAWTALLTATGPKDVLGHPRLHAARAEVNAEVERCTHTAPKFTPDGRVAVFRIRSAAQVHPVIATRWAGHLNSKALQIVMVANEGYLEGKVNFSCRVARCARARGEDVDIIVALKEYASLKTSDDTDEIPLLDRLGDDFARGHVQASGGIVSTDEFEELYKLMRVGEKSEGQMKKEQEKNSVAGTGASPSKGKKAIDAAQTNTLMGYFGKAKGGGAKGSETKVK